MKKRLLTMLVLLVAVAAGAWAQSTTHVVKQDNINTVFSGDGYTLGDAVKDGDVLDFQGTIDLEGDASHSLVINKPVTVISSTKDAVVKLHTPEGALSGENPDKSFVINKAGSGTTVQDIRIENTETWLYNTSNVTFTGVTMWVEEARVGSGVGHVSIRYSDHVTFDGCTVYAKNNGGSSGCVLTGSHDCTFKDTRFEAVGNAGNILYLGYAFATDKPADYTMNNDNVSVLNCTLTKSAASSVGMFSIGGLRHHIEGCTLVKMSTSSPYGATVPNSASEGHTILNNTITDGTLNVLQYSTAEGNTVTGAGSVTIYQGATANNNNITVTGSVTIYQGATATNNNITLTGTGRVIVRKGSTVTGNTINGNVTINSNGSDFVGSTITGNTINGTVTFALNSKNNTLTRNVITSTDDYAVVMASTADANNTVQYNTLKSAKYNGDEAVNPSTGTGNTISNNSNIALTLAEGTEDADKWSVKVGEEAAAFPVGGLNGGETVTVTYSGEKKVKSVKAVKKVDPKLATPMTIEAITAGTIIVKTPKEGMQYSLNGGAKTTMSSANTTIDVAAGDKVAFYGNGTTITSYGSSATYDCTRITGNGDGFTCKVYGNIMSLVDEKNFATAKTLSEAYAFCNLFYSNTTLTDASGLLLPATELAPNCYNQMFINCTALTTAPALPATQLAEACYYNMFYRCDALTAAPELPATQLAEYCYYSMFRNCTSLTAAPALPATQLAKDCYNQMFRGCTALTTAPELPAPTLVSNCYYQMFDSCSKLATVTCLAESGIDTESSTTNWLSNTGSQAQGTKTFYTVSSANWPDGNNGIPNGWTRVNVDN